MCIQLRVKEGGHYVPSDSAAKLPLRDQRNNIAGENALDPTQMALAFARKRPFIASLLLGATTVNQLERNFASVDIKLSEEVLQEIEEIHNRIPNPCP